MMKLRSIKTKKKHAEIGIASIPVSIFFLVLFLRSFYLRDNHIPFDLFGRIMMLIYFLCPLGLAISGFFLRNRNMITPLFSTLIALIAPVIILIAVTSALLDEKPTEPTPLEILESVLQNLGMIAFQYRIRPVSMGGGGGSYRGFDFYFAELPIELMTRNENGEYSCNEDDILPDSLRIRGVMTAETTSIRWVVADSVGKMRIYDTEPLLE